MSNQPQPKNSKNAGWGTFFTQAVAGVEAHLDNMLTEAGEGEGHPPARGPANTKPTPLSSSDTPQRQTTPAPAAPSPTKNKPAVPRSSSSHSHSRVNDRLQERLAKALVAKSGNTHGEPNSARASIDEASTTTSVEPSSARQSEDAASTHSRSSATPDLPPRAVSPMRATPNPESKPDSTPEEEIEATPSSKQEEDAGKDDTPQDTDVAPETTTRKSADTGRASPAPAPAPAPTASTSLLTTTQAEQQEELHHYIEQVDALQSKLQYLSKEASETARKAAQDAPAGSSDRKIAEKDEKIVLLMEEGRSMAANEQKLRNIVKKLRGQLVESEKAIADLKAGHEKTKAELETVRTRTARLGELEKEQSESQRLLGRTRADLESLRSDVAIKETTIKSLQGDLQKAHDENDSAASRKEQDDLAAEQKRTKDLEDNIASLQVEKDLMAERAKKNAAELNEKAERTAERARVSELELKGEIQAMEGKLEAMRAMAEEASSGAVGDSQAKLLRQTETLQTQHAIASENWQGIEASLVARVGNLEKERDEALRRESEMRKKARETTMRCKSQEEEIEDLTGRIPNHQKELDELREQTEKSQKRAEAAETALGQAKADFEKQQQQQQAAWTAPPGQSNSYNEQPDRRLWLDDVPGTAGAGAPSFKNQSRPESPLLSVPTRTLSSDLVALQPPPGRGGLKMSTLGSGNDGGGLTGGSTSPGRRLSSQPPSRPPILSPNLFSSSASMSSPQDPPLPTPTMPRGGGTDDDFHDGTETASSPRQMMQDMVSVSTVGAGPSVQLVERMSAAIRRLEAEKVASREELARISGQRDEARAEIVGLMKQSEASKVASKRVEELEAEVAGINTRYQTTLELLGEKSELVDELRADVQDVKAMYRDLVERTVKG